MLNFEEENKLLWEYQSLFVAVDESSTRNGTKFLEH